MELTDKQTIALNVAVKRYQMHEKYTVIAGYAGSGKAQPVDTIIPTPSGNRRLGDLQVGDFVFDRRGKPTKILGVFPQGVIDNYKITLEDGRFTFCNGEHLWSYYTSKGNLSTKTTLEMLNAGLKYAGKGSYKFKIPNIFQPVEFNFLSELKIDPYVIGAFLGDGCCKERQLTLSSGDEELVQEVAKLIHAKSYNRRSELNYSWSFDLPDSETSYYNNILNNKFLTKNFFAGYEKEMLCGAEEKRIPYDYKYSSIQDRYSLLQGLLDTDGSIRDCDNKRYNIVYTSINLNLIKDIQDVLYSLGYKSSISEDKREEKYSTKICYSLCINIPNEEKYKLFRLKRKRDIAIKAQEYHKHKDYSKIAIVKIEKMDEQKEMLCLYVDNEEHLYLTNDYIVTHNTSLIKYIIAALKVPETQVCYATYTGKAAQVLMKKGNNNISTLHKLLYDSIRRADGKFIHRPKPAIPYTVIVADECSMIPKDMVRLLLSHQCYVIFLGDPFQLPPVNPEETNDLLEHPHIFLDEVLRQQQENEIIRITMDIREGKPLSYFDGHDVKIYNRRDLVDGMYTWADQILVGTNKTRIAINNEMRKKAGFGPEPEPGDKLIVLKNNWDIIADNEEPLVNGTIGFLGDGYKTFFHYPYYINGGGTVDLYKGEFVSETGGDFGMLSMDYKLLMEGEKGLDWKTEYALSKNPKFMCSLPQEFSYGYAITTHKAQGSQWPKVLIIEESFPFGKKEHQRWLYTAVSRSSEKCVLIR